ARSTLFHFTTLFRAQGRYEAALESYQQALTILREVGDRAGEGTALNNIGFVYRAQGRYEAALNSYQQAIELFDLVRGEAGSEASRVEFIVQHIHTYRAMVDLLVQQDQAADAFLIVEQSRGRAFLDSLSTGHVQLADNTAADLLTEEQELYAQRQTLQDHLARAKADPASNTELINNLEAQLVETEKAYQAVSAAIAGRSDELAALIPGRSADNILGVEQVQARLDEQTTLVSYYLLPDKLLAFILTADGFETIVLDVDPTELVQEISKFRDFADLNPAHPANAVTLHEMLIAPLQDKLTTPRLIIIPHQSLHYLPFAALTDGERYLIDDYTLTVLPNASTLPFIQENAQQTAYSGQPIPLLLGNPVTGDYDTTASLVVDQSQYRGQLGSLPFAEKEAKTIADLFGVEPLIGEAATESAVREQVPQANILHLAAHGEFNPVAPLNSLIALAPDDDNDGWLTVGESYGLDLEKTDLVVLSACETNLGDLSAGDELVGLTRALIFAGTPSVIASLWAVEDEATSQLMERFYMHLKDGLGKAEALRQAQIEVREEYPNPYYWSGFVLSGDPGFEVGSTDAARQSETVTSSESSNGDEADEIQSSRNCLSLLVILGVVGAVGVSISRRSG
ncbi:MAG: CHAT domain-containing protein, partial [Anaerolineae bacterium]|nr:CHAT domain-containing protein [Anaerolineae bacterium]